MRKGQKATTETKLKQSIAHSGVKPWNKGIPRTNKEKKNISNSLLGYKKGVKFSDSHKHKISESLKNGQYFNCLTCGNVFYRANGLILKGQCKYCSRGCFQQGKQNRSKKPHITAYRKTTVGDKSPTWKGGITPENIKIRQSEKYKKWRTNVFTRDNYTCQDCKNTGIYLHAHHVKSFSEFKKLRFDINNGVTLCEKCHKKLHNLVRLRG